MRSVHSGSHILGEFHRYYPKLQPSITFSHIHVVCSFKQGTGLPVFAERPSAARRPEAAVAQLCRSIATVGAMHALLMVIAADNFNY